jgi:peptidoglycan/LPS O-acetylase OafA/YrhL
MSPRCVGVTTARPANTPSGDRTAPTGELRGLTGLRIVAAVWVVGFHFHFTALPGVADVVGVLGPLVTTGALGVDLFFVLSGFVIAHTYLDRLGPRLRGGATARFAWARAARMWPAYALVLHVFGLWLVARLVLGGDGPIAFQAVQPVVDPGQWLQQLLMVQLWDDPYFDGASWVGSTWSISAEWLAYVLFPVAALVFHRMRNLPVAVLAAASLALMTPMMWAYLLTGSPYHPWSWAVRILCGFGAGILAHLVVRRLGAGGASERVRRGASALAAALPVVVAAGLLAGGSTGRGGAVLVLFPLLVGAVALADRGPVVVLSQEWAVRGGRLSYALYLVHIPVFEVYWLAMARSPRLAAPTAEAHLVGLAVFVLPFLLAAAVYRLVEEPGRRRMRAVFPEPVAVDAVARSARGGAVRSVDAAGPARGRAVGAVPGPAAPGDAVPSARGGAVPTAGGGAVRSVADAAGPVRGASRSVPAPAAPAGSGGAGSRRAAGVTGAGHALPAQDTTGAVARIVAARTGRPAPARHAASPSRRSTLAAALVSARRRPAAHRAGGAPLVGGATGL